VQTNGFAVDSSGRMTYSSFGSSAIFQVDQVNCAYQVPQVNLPMSRAGDRAKIEIFASDGCPWTLGTVEPWITVTPASGTGKGVVQVIASPNDTQDIRRGTITVPSGTVTISQDPATNCTYQVDKRWITLPANYPIPEQVTLTT